MSRVFFGTDQDVIELDVSMDDLLLLEKVEGKQQLLNNDSRLGFTETALEFGHHVHQCALRLVLEDHVKRLGVLEHLQQSHSTSALDEGPVDLYLVDKIIDQRLFLLHSDFINFLDSHDLLVL